MLAAADVHPLSAFSTVFNMFFPVAPQMQQGRRTASMKASYDAISAGGGGGSGGGGGGGASGEFTLARELAGAAHTALASSGLVGTERKRK